MIGPALAAAVCLIVVAEATGRTGLAVAAGIVVAIAVAVMLPGVRLAGRVFAAVAALLAVLTVWTTGGSLSPLGAPLAAAGFIAAFFSVVAALRDAALTSPSLERCGRYFAEQPPGRRYLMLTLGGHFFSLMLSYGALSLLGTMAERVAGREPDPAIRAIRIRRMLLAIQRGLVGTLCWSPVAFPMALATTVVPGADWGAVAPFCLVSGLLLMGLGWGLDTLLKPAPRPGGAPAGEQRAGNWCDVRPLAILLCAILIPLVAIQNLSGLRAVAVAMILVPPLCLGWIAIQNGGRLGGLAAALRRAQPICGWNCRLTATNL